MTVYISIGNSDDKLTQRQWYYFCSRVRACLNIYGAKFHGEWYSLPNAEFQNACWCAELPIGARKGIQEDLAKIASMFNQESISWAEANTEFIYG